MSLSSNSGQRMSCNMTFKALCLALALLILAMSPAPALAEEEDAPSSAELLLLYDQSNRGLAEEDIERFSFIASCMGKSLAFGDVKDFQDSLAMYDYVVCYRLEDISEESLRAIRDYQGELFIFGSAFMKRYLDATGRSDLVLWESGLDRGVMEYAFSTSAVFETIVDVKDMIRFQTESEGRGTVSVGGQAYPFVSRVGGARFTPITGLGTELAQAAVMQELTDWMWPYADPAPDYHQYLVLDSIYPFMDAGVLLDQVNALIEEGLPFVLSVMPLYKNTSYPAMTQFCQVLQYAQQNGGFVVMHAPIIQSVMRDADEMYAVLTDSLAAYLDQGVYPLGIEVPLRWTYDDFYLEIMRRYRTVFVYDDGAGSGFSLAAGHNKLYDNAHQLIMPVIELDDTRATHMTCYASAVYLDAYRTDVEQIHELAALMKKERVPFQNLWEMPHAVWGNDISLNYERGMLRLNGETVAMTYEPIPYDEDYDYQRDIIKRVTISIQRQNKALMAVTVMVVFVFAMFMVYLRRLNKRSFFYVDER